MQYQKVQFENHDGIRLSAQLDYPDDIQPKAYVLFAHCFTCNKNFKAVYNISRALTDDGFAVFRFDFTGLGESDGDFSQTNFTSNVEDLIEAARFMEKQYHSPQLLVGHSLGGTAVLQAARNIDTMKAIVTISSPSEPSHVNRLLESSMDELIAAGKTKITIAGRTFTITKQFLDDLEQSRMTKTIKSLKCALLVVHSPDDTIVKIENAHQIYNTAQHPKSFLSIEGADHLLSDRRDSRYVGKVIATWASRYISMNSEDERIDQDEINVCNDCSD